MKKPHSVLLFNFGRNPSSLFKPRAPHEYTEHPALPEHPDLLHRLPRANNQRQNRQQVRRHLQEKAEVGIDAQAVCHAQNQRRPL